MDGPILLKSTITPRRTPQAGRSRLLCEKVACPTSARRCGGARVPPVSLLGGPEIKTPFLREER